MAIHMRPYAGAADIQTILALKRVCTTSQKTSVFLETQQDNAAALHLFTSVGFRAVSAGNG